MVDVGHAAHGQEGEVVQQPAQNGVSACVVELLEFVVGEIVVAALPADGVEGGHGAEVEERGEAGPVDEGVAEEEVFDDWVWC